MIKWTKFDKISSYCFFVIWKLVWKIFVDSKFRPQKRKYWDGTDSTRPIHFRWEEISPRKYFQSVWNMRSINQATHAFAFQFSAGQRTCVSIPALHLHNWYHSLSISPLQILLSWLSKKIDIMELGNKLTEKITIKETIKIW